MNKALVKNVQEFIKGQKPYGIGYPLPADGEATPQLLSVLKVLESLAASNGITVHLVSGNTVSYQSLTDLAKLIAPPKPAPQETKTPDAPKKPPVSKDKASPKKEEEEEELKDIELLDSNPHKEWEAFFQSNLPVVGNIYDGNVESTAKKLEKIIGEKLNKNVSGVIWNNSTKKFNTSTDDVRSALELLGKKNIEKVNFNRDQRLMKYTQILFSK